MGRRPPREHPRCGPSRGDRCGKPSVLNKFTAGVTAGLVAVAVVAGSLAGCSNDSGQRTNDASQEAQSSSSAEAPTDGAAGVGDPYFPDLGNGGYDVAHYDLAITVPDPKQNLIDARATITARSTQALARFDFDLSGLTVKSVTVDGAAATVERKSRELVVTPAQPIEDDHDFTTVIDYTGGPLPRSTPSLPIVVGWISTGNGSFVLSQPEGASTWFPANDHPIDKATYTFHVDVPDGVTAVANGDLVGQAPAGAGRVTWTYDVDDPMATYLAQVVVGDFRVTNESGPDGVEIRNVLDSALADEAAPLFTRTPEMISFFSSLFGKYPFAVYGAAVVNERTLLSLETQTLSTFGSELVDDADAETTVAHELAHQWFGDSVSIESWKDMWLNEGFATYAEWMWKEHTTGVPVAQTVETVLAELRGDPRSEVPPGDPGAENLFGISVYRRGALTLQALRLTIGDDAFFTTLKTYVSKFASANVSTDDFISVAEEVSGRQDLQPLFDTWLYQPALPALPG